MLYYFTSLWNTMSLRSNKDSKPLRFIQDYIQRLNHTLDTFNIVGSNNYNRITWNLVDECIGNLVNRDERSKFLGNHTQFFDYSFRLFVLF